MKVSAHRAFNLLKELAYERVSCSEAEKQAARKLLEVAQSTGAVPNLCLRTHPSDEVYQPRRYRVGCPKAV